MPSVRGLSVILVGGLLAAGTLSSAQRAEAGKCARGDRTCRQRQASPATSKAINKLLGKFKWGMSSRQVLDLLSAKVRKRYAQRLTDAKDPLVQDKLRAELRAELAKLKGSIVKFGGQRSSWDISLVSGEFAHRNDEAMAVMWNKKDRRFYFFHRDRLWKIFIGFNSSLYQGKTFDDFAAVMERRFGRAKRKFTTNVEGEQVMTHLEWPPARRTLLKAVDNTDPYGNFCLVLVDRGAWASVREGRRVNAPKRSNPDALIDTVMRDEAKQGVDPNADIVDRITGKDGKPEGGGKP